MFKTLLIVKIVVAEEDTVWLAPIKPSLQTNTLPVPVDDKATVWLGHTVNVEPVTCTVGEGNTVIVNCPETDEQLFMVPETV